MATKVTSQISARFTEAPKKSTINSALSTKVDGYFNGFKGNELERMTSYISSHKTSWIAKAKQAGKPIIFHQNSIEGGALQRSVMVTPKGDFYLLLNRHKTEGDQVIGNGASKKVSLAIKLNDGQLYASGRMNRKDHESQIEVERANIKPLKSVDGVNHVDAAVEYTGKDGVEKVRFISLFCNEGDLAHAIEKQTLTFEEKFEVAGDVASTYASMHEAGIFHRDGKPGNILLNRDEQGKLSAHVADFDTSGKQSKVGNEHQTVLEGTPGYVAPELKRAADFPKQTGKADVYSYGVTMVQLFTGKSTQEIGGNNPYSPEYFQAVHREAVELANQHPELEPIVRAVAIDPAERISSTELAAALNTK